MNEELGQVRYIFSDKTGTLTCNEMVFKCMSIRGRMYGSPHASCTDAKAKAVTNFDMADADLTSLLATGAGGLETIDSQNVNRAFADAHAYLTHLALCHTIVSARNPRKENEISLNASSPDELALLNAAKYYGLRFYERLRDEIILEDLSEVEPSDS